MSLKKQAIFGLIWTVADTLVLRGLFFIATIVLARILGPVEFGLFGMISIFIAIGTSIVDSGLSASLIRTQNACDKDYSTVFYLNISLSLLIYSFFFLLAPFVASFYGQEVLEPIIRVYCLTFVVSAFSAVQLAILNKDMRFNSIMKLSIPGTLLGVAVGILLGYLGYGVWSIVWMHLTNQLVLTTVLWISSNWSPKLLFDKTRAKYHYVFGYKLMLSGLIDTIFKNVYNIIIGKFFSVKLLGFYERARSFNEYPVTVLTGVISKVTYPLFSGIQDDAKRISNVYAQIMQFSFFVIAPMMLAACAVAKPLFYLILGEQWLPAVPFFQVLCLSGMFYPIHSLNINIFKVYGRSDLFLKLEILKKIVITITVIISFKFGIMGLVWSSVITSYIALLINTYYSGDMIEYSAKKQFKDMAPIFILSISMAAIMMGLLSLLKDYSLYIQIILPTIIGLLFYICFNFLIKSNPMLFVIKILKDRKYDTSN